ncbi:Transducin-like enhancer protein 1 [Plecturocebus cupreus]
MFPQSWHPTPHQAADQPFKFTIRESLDGIKEEFQLLQAQYQSLKLECEKLASEKTEMQRNYEHQHQVAQAVERAKQVTMAELKAIIGQQQLQAQHLSHGHGTPSSPYASPFGTSASWNPTPWGQCRPSCAL